MEVFVLFREMRRKKQRMTEEDCAAVLARRTAGVLAVCEGGDDYPYAVPISYSYHGGKLYFHCAVEGHKLDAIRKNPKISFCVIDEDQVKPAGFTTYFRSVILFGTARVLADEGEKRQAMEVLAAKYSPDHEEGRKEALERQFKQFCVVEVTIDHMTGKESMELREEK